MHTETEKNEHRVRQRRTHKACKAHKVHKDRASAWWRGEKSLELKCLGMIIIASAVVINGRQLGSVLQEALQLGCHSFLLMLYELVQGRGET